MLVPALFALLQVQAQAPAQKPSPVARVDVTPATAEIEVGQTVQLSAKPLDAQGQPVSDARIFWFVNGSEGEVDSTGLVTAGYQGTIRVTAVAAVEGAKPYFQPAAVIKVTPLPASRLELSPALGRVLVGTRLTLGGTAYSKHGDRRHDPVTFTSSNPRVASVTSDGRLVAVAPGRVTITGKAGGATSTMALNVIANPIARFSIEPGSSTARTGDVVRFRPVARDAQGRTVQDFAVRWSVAGNGGVAQVDEQGAFVAERPGKYTVSAAAGSLNAEAVVTVEPRRVTRGMEVLGRLPIEFSTGEVWVHQGGTCAYLTTLADRVYAVDVTDPKQPKIVDSMMTNARIINDVMTTEDGKYGVFSREGASDRKNGIVIFDASDPCHPKPISEYTETVSGGVHSSFVYQGHVFLTDDATGSMRVIDIRDPLHPREVGRWQTEQTEAGRYLHDIDVEDGLAYLSYWNDGLVVLDVGNGIKGGRPDSPKFVSQLKYNLSEEYARVDQLYGLGARGTHTAWRHKNYVFVGDEVYASRSSTGLEDGNNLTFGKLHVIDVSDIEHPRRVAWYEPTDAGVHNVWVEGDTLYMGSYQGGARVLDISGELKGDLLRQGREISWIFTADSMGHRPRATFAWGAVVKNGNIFVPDINTGLWVMRVEPKQQEFTP